MSQTVGRRIGPCKIVPRSHKEYELLLIESEVQISVWGRQILYEMDLVHYDVGIVEMVVVSNNELGFTEEWVRENGNRHPKYRETQERAQSLGLKIPPIQLAPECLINFYQPQLGYITLAAQPVRHPLGTIQWGTFEIGHKNGVQHLMGTPARPVNERGPDFKFIFVV